MIAARVITASSGVSTNPLGALERFLDPLERERVRDHAVPRHPLPRLRSHEVERARQDAHVVLEERDEAQPASTRLQRIERKREPGHDRADLEVRAAVAEHLDAFLTIPRTPATSATYVAP